jgi:thiol-disulfide isomerase/thioredoxin
MKSIVAGVISFFLCTSVYAQDSLSTLKAAVEAQPDSLSVHQRYITAFRKSISGANFRNIDSVLGLLEPQYAAWMNQFPQSAVVPFAIGDAFTAAENPRAKPYLLKAVGLDPNMAPAWMDLWEDGERWGDFKASQAYLKHAVDADPSNPNYAFYYAGTFETSDPVTYKKLSLKVVNDFPTSERGAQALYWLGFRSPDMKDKMTYFEELRGKFPPDKFGWSASGMSGYFDILLGTDPAKAVELARYMTGLKLEADEKKEWTNQTALAEKISKASALLDQHKPADALQALAGIKLKSWSDARETLNLLKARAINAGGNTGAAYDSLLVFFAKEPSDETHEVMLRYATKLGKDAAWVDEGVRQRRLSTASPAPVFKLAAYLTHDSISLADYKGKTVLLTFWFPGCGPCRGEFPHFQTVLNKFKGKDIAFVGINVLTFQDPYVVPFMQSSGYGFTPLRDDKDWAVKAYKVRGEPTNFLIDKEGRIIFSNFMIQNEKAQRMLELMINSML